MLVLARKKGESIMIDHDISITILGIEGDVVKIGMVAPKDVSIYRKEIYEAIQISNQQAIVTTPTNEELQSLLSKANPKNKSIRFPKQK